MTLSTWVSRFTRRQEESRKELDKLKQKRGVQLPPQKQPVSPIGNILFPKGIPEQPAVNPFRTSDKTTSAVNPFRKDTIAGRPFMQQPSGEPVRDVQGNIVFKEPVKALNDAPDMRLRGQESSNPVIQWANTPTAIFDLTPADIAGIGTIAVGGAEAAKGLYDKYIAFRRLPQYQAVEQFAKAQAAQGKQVNPQAKQSAQNAIRSAFNLYKNGMTEAADEIMARFQQSYEKTFKAPEPVRAETPLALGTRPIPRATQTGAMAMGGKANEFLGKQSVSRTTRANGTDIRVEIPTNKGLVINAHNSGEQFKLAKPPAANDKVWSVSSKEISGATGDTTTNLLKSGLTKDEAIEYVKNYGQPTEPTLSDLQLKANQGEAVKAGGSITKTPDGNLTAIKPNGGVKLFKDSDSALEFVRGEPKFEPMAASTSVQTGLSGFGKEAAQAQMFGEVSGKTGKKQTLIDVDAEKAKAAAKPLEGQTELIPEEKPALSREEIETLSGQQMEAQAQDLKYTLDNDPLADLRFRMGAVKVAIDSPRMLDSKEKTFAYGDSFTPAQAKALRPEVTFSEANKIKVKHTIKLKNGRTIQREELRIRADAVLDRFADEYTNGDVNAFIERVNNLIDQKRQLRNLQLDAGVLADELNAALPVEALKGIEQPFETAGAVAPPAPPVTDAGAGTAGGGVAPPPPPSAKPTLSEEFTSALDDINSQLEGWKAVVKGLRKDNAAEARKAIKLLETELKNAKAIVTEGATTGDIKQMRQQVMAISKFKGLPESQMKDIFKRVTGKTEIRKMTEAQLADVLTAIKKARPTKIKGRIVLKAATEKAIQSLKTTLISQGDLNEKAYQEIKAYLKLRTDKYITPRLFITEAEAKSLIRMMNYEAEIGLIKYENEVSQALDAAPPLKGVIDRLASRSSKDAPIQANGVKVSPAWDYWVYNERLENRTGIPSYRLYRRTLDTSLENDHKVLDAERRMRESTPAFQKIYDDKGSDGRIRAYLADRLGQPVQVKEMSDDEVKLAQEIERIFFEEIPNVRFKRFLDAYRKNDGDINKIAEAFPQSSSDPQVLSDLKQAVRIYESGGALQLKSFLDTKTWGVMNTGYEPHRFVNPKMVEHRISSAVSKGMLQAREDLPTQRELESMHIIDAVLDYKRRMLNLDLEPYFYKWNQVLRDAGAKLRDPQDTANHLSLMFQHMKRGANITHPLAKVISKIGGYVSSVVYIPPHLGLRNIFQPLWLNPYRQELFNPLNKPLSEEARNYFEIYGQGGGQLMESLLQYELGKGKVAQFIRKVSPMSVSETWNNRWTDWAMVNKAQRALEDYRKTGDIERFIKYAGVEDLTYRQQKEVIELMALGKEDEATWLIARKINQNTNMIYDQRQAGPLTAGEVGTLLGSLGRFPRGYAQRMYEQVEKLKSGNWREKKLAASVIAGAVVMGFVGNFIWQKVTGRKDDPYNPLSVITWSPGGLQVGAAADMSEIVADIFAAATGDDDALMRLPTGLERGSNMLIPFYVPILNALEAMSQTKYADRKTVRKVIALIKEDYHPDESYYNTERNWIQSLQHALFGSEPVEQPNAISSSGSKVKIKGGSSITPSRSKVTIK